MCACGELDPSYVCVTHRETRHDPHSDPDRNDPYYEPEVQSPAEYEVLDG